jgi:hypothetical protein
MGSLAFFIAPVGSGFPLKASVYSLVPVFVQYRYPTVIPFRTFSASGFIISKIAQMGLALTSVVDPNPKESEHFGLDPNPKKSSD